MTRTNREVYQAFCACVSQCLGRLVLQKAIRTHEPGCTTKVWYKLLSTTLVNCKNKRLFVKDKSQGPLSTTAVNDSCERLHAMLCCAMPCYAVICYAMLWHAMRRHAMPATLCYAMLCYALLRCPTLRYASKYAMLRYATLCYAMLTVLC